MIQLHKHCIIGVLACLGACSGGMSQVSQDGQLTAQTDAPKVAKRGNTRGAVIRGTAKNSVLFFQPQIGWQRVPSGELNLPATPGTASSGKLKDPITGNESPAMTFARSTAMNNGILAPVPANLLLNPVSDATSGPRGLMSSGATRFSPGAKVGVSSDEVSDLKSRAYISPIMLRRMIRNAPDLQRRIELQELQRRLSRKPRVSAADSKATQTRKRGMTNHEADSALSPNR